MWTLPVDRVPDGVRRRHRAAAASGAVGIAIFRGLLLFPYIVPTVVIALIWRWIFNPEIGVVNYALQSRGHDRTQPIYWLSTPSMAMASTIMLNVWKYTPFVVICVLARLQTVPLELYDAAKVDGAGSCAASSTSRCRSSGRC